MEFHINTLIAAMLVATTGVHVQAATRPHSNTLIVETPTNHPVLAEENAHAIYLHKTNDGRALLYIEQQSGRGISVLDVTDPSKVKRIAQTSFPTASAFDFVRDVDDNVALIRFSDGSGFALLNLEHSRRPVLLDAPALAQARNPEMLGQTGMLVAVTENSPIPAGDPKSYKVLDTANASGPEVLAAISDVTHRVENDETGTLFLLNKDGVTMIRRPRVEAERQAELTRERGN